MHIFILFYLYILNAHSNCFDTAAYRAFAKSYLLFCFAVKISFPVFLQAIKFFSGDSSIGPPEEHRVPPLSSVSPDPTPAADSGQQKLSSQGDEVFEPVHVSNNNSEEIHNNKLVDEEPESVITQKSEQKTAGAGENGGGGDASHTEFTSGEQIFLPDALAVPVSSGLTNAAKSQVAQLEELWSKLSQVCKVRPEGNSSSVHGR